MKSDWWSFLCCRERSSSCPGQNYWAVGVSIRFSYRLQTGAHSRVHYSGDPREKSHRSSFVFLHLLRTLLHINLRSARLIKFKIRYSITFVQTKVYKPDKHAIRFTKNRAASDWLVRCNANCFQWSLSMYSLFRFQSTFCELKLQLQGKRSFFML